MGAKEGGIFDAHLLVLEDRTLLDEVIRNHPGAKVNAEYAFHASRSNTRPRWRRLKMIICASAPRTCGMSRPGF